MTVIRLAARTSPLAIRQAEEAARLLAAARPNCTVTQVGVLSAGDKKTGPLASSGGKNLFVQALQQALLDNQAEAACHSLKDLGRCRPGFRLAAYLPRRDPRDALVGLNLTQLRALPAPHLGTASPRRAAMLKAELPAVRLSLLRGNVGTRIARLEAGEFDALMLACAGLDRLGLSGLIAERIAPTTLLPAPGQGTVVLECRNDNDDLAQVLAGIDDIRARRTGLAERACAEAAGADCSTPLGAYATLNAAGTVTVACELRTPDGSERVAGIAQDPDPERAGTFAAQRLLAAGGDRIMAAR